METSKAASRTGSPPESTVDGPGLRFGALLPKLGLSLLIAAAFTWLLRRGGLPILPRPEAFASVVWWTLPVHVALVLAYTAFRTYRWIYLLLPVAPELSRRRALGVALVGLAAVMFAPLRLGEVVRPWLVSRDRKVSFTQATGTVAAERIVDGLTITLLMVASLPFSVPLSPLPSRVGKLSLPVAAVPGAAYGMLAVFSVALSAMTLFYFRRDDAIRIIHAVFGRVSGELSGWITGKVEKFADGLKFLPSGAHARPFVRDTLAYWLLNVISQWVLLRGSGTHATVFQACVTLGATGLGVLLPSGPGFFGTFQLSVYCGLAMFFGESVVLSSGAAFAFLGYVTQLGVNVVAAVIGYALLNAPRESR